MTQAEKKRPKPVDSILAEDLDRELDDELAALPPATPVDLSAAFEVIGNELSRRQVLAERAGDKSNAQRLWAGIWSLTLVESALREETLLNDFLRHAEDVREELATLPPFNPDEDDAWILKPDRTSQDAPVNDPQGGIAPMREIIRTERAPAAIGPYSQGVKANGFVFTAGQGGVDPATGKIVEGGIEAQTRQTLTNIQAILEAAGTSLANVVKVTVFLHDINDFAAMNGVYKEFFSSAPPARTTVAAKDLPLGVLVEIDVVAVA